MFETTDFYRGYNRFKNELLPKFCFYGGDSCDKQIIKAHSVQNNKILSSISEGGEVLKFQVNPTSNNLDIQALKVGRKKASIFTGFCKYHDNIIFQPIEVNEYLEGNKEQHFLFAYRALAFEYYAKRYQNLFFNKMFEAFLNRDREFLKNYFSIEPPFPPNFFKLSAKLYEKGMEGSKDSLEQLEKTRNAFNINLDKKRFYKIKTLEIKFENRYEIATSGAATIENDLTGNIINEIPKLGSYLTYLFITVFPKDDKTIILLSCLKRDYSKYERFFKQIGNLTTKKKMIVISVLLISYIENIFISPRLWNNLNYIDKSFIEKTFNETIVNKPKEMFEESKFNIFIQ